MTRMIKFFVRELKIKSADACDLEAAIINARNALTMEELRDFPGSEVTAAQIFVDAYGQTMVMFTVLRVT